MNNSPLTETQANTMSLVDALAMQCTIVCQQLEWATAGGTCDPRWLALARTDLQKGIMALRRSVTTNDTNAF